MSEPDHRKDLTIALCQYAAKEDKQANLLALEPWILRASESGADLAVLPEYGMYMPKILSQEIWRQGEGLDGPFVSEVRGLAAKHSIVVFCNIAERDPSSVKPFNTQVVIDANGEIMATYRKVHLYDAHGYVESDYFETTSHLAPVIVGIKGWSVALQTCYDLRFPEGARVAAEAGADVVVYSTAFVPGPRKEDQWATLVRARAIENTIFVAAGVQAHPAAIGGSLISDPMGIVVGEAGAKDELLVRSLAYAPIQETRADNPCLSNRRYRIDTSTALSPSSSNNVTSVKHKLSNV